MATVSSSSTKLILRWAQRLMFAAGVLLIGLYTGTSFHATIVSRIAQSKFGERSSQPLEPQGKVDFSLWSKQRIAAYEESLFRHFDMPIALMRIRRLGLEAPVLEGTDDLTLDRGIGHISGTALPGENGNVALAGHRDGFFRVLKDIKPGDEIEVLTAGMRDTYAVEQIVVVLPNDVAVLQQESRRFLTLVTCYPFYFIGSAPKRYIVKALLVRSEVVSPAGEDTSEIVASKRPATRD